MGGAHSLQQQPPPSLIRISAPHGSAPSVRPSVRHRQALIRIVARSYVSLRAEETNGSPASITDLAIRLADGRTWRDALQPMHVMNYSAPSDERKTVAASRAEERWMDSREEEEERSIYAKTSAIK